MKSESDLGLTVTFIHERIPLNFVEIMESRRMRPMKREGKPAEHMLVRFAKGRGFISANGKSVLFYDFPYEFGGRTTAIVKNQDGEVIATGVSVCSMSEQFSYERGRQIARGRALKKALRIQPIMRQPRLIGGD